MVFAFVGGLGEVSYPPYVGGLEGSGFLCAADRAKSPLWEGWEGPGFLSAADRAKSPGRAGRGQVSYLPRIGQNCLCEVFLSATDRAKSPPRIGQNRLCGRAGRGQGSYPPRIRQKWEGWEGQGKIAFVGGLGGARFPIRCR